MEKRGEERILDALALGLGLLLVWLSFTQSEEPGRSRLPEPRPASSRAAPLELAELPPTSRRTPVASPSSLVVEGVCTDWSGAPITPPPRLRVGCENGRNFLTAVAADGTFRVAGLSPGRLTIECAGDGHATATEVHWLTEERPSLWLAIALERLRTVEVRLVTPQGEPFQNVTRGFGLDSTPINLAASSSTGEKLTFRRGIPAGSWGSFDMPESASGEVVARLGETELASFPVEPFVTRLELPLSLHEVRSCLATVSLRIVSAEDGAELVEASAWLETDSRRIASIREPDGAWILRCPPGKARLSAGAPGRERMVREFHLEPGAFFDLATIPLARAREAACSGARSQ